MTQPPNLRFVTEDTLDEFLGAKADLVGGKLDPAQVPALALSDFLGEAATQAAMLTLTGQRGDWAIRTDSSTVWMVIAEPSSTLASWRQLATPAVPVQSVAGKTGAVTLVKGDVGLGNVDNTSDAAKPVSTAVQTALDGKEPAEWTGTQAAYDALGTKDPNRSYNIT